MIRWMSSYLRAKFGILHANKHNRTKAKRYGGEGWRTSAGIGKGGGRKDK